MITTRKHNRQAVVGNTAIVDDDVTRLNWLCFKRKNRYTVLLLLIIKAIINITL